MQELAVQAKPSTYDLNVNIVIKSLIYAFFPFFIRKFEKLQEIGCKNFPNQQRRPVMAEKE